jgi:signal transduction histidine kinase
VAAGRGDGFGYLGGEGLLPLVCVANLDDQVTGELLAGRLDRPNRPDTSQQPRGQRRGQLLQVARLPSDQWAATEPVPLDDVLAETERRWHGPLAKQGRRLSLRRPQDKAIAKIPGRVVGQILDILLDNASGHGLGAVTVTVTARDIGDAVAIEVADEGFLSIPMTNLFTRESGAGAGHGIGLGLARSLAEACGGRLNVASEAPTTFSLVLPLDPDDKPMLESR